MGTEANVPKLRFPEFKEVWEKKKLGMLGDYIGGGTPNTSVQEYWEGNIPWISSSDIIENDISNIHIQKYITDEAIKNSATKKIPANSLIIVSRVGVGKFAINKNVVCTSQDFTNIVVNSKIFDAHFSAFNLYKNIDLLYNISQGTSIKGFTTVDLKKSELSFPSLSEQTKIASFLTAVDDKLQALKKKKELLEQYKKGMMQQLFSQEIRFKKDDGTNYPDWEEKKLGEVCNFSNGKAHENEINENGKYIVVNSKFVSSGGIVKKFSNKQIVPLFKDDIVMVMSDVPNGKALAKCYLIESDEKYTLNQRICVLRAKKSHNSFLIYLINRNEFYLSFDSGVGQTNLKKEDVLNCPLYIPSSLEEQSKIANFLSAIDEKITHCQSELDGLEQWKKGLLQQMFC